MASQKEPSQGSDPRLRQIPVRYLVPNIVTLLALCSGITAIRLGMDGRFELAVACVILAALLDALDGRIARALKGSSKFGAELDSLADFVNFGVVPGLLIYMWSLNALKSLGWIVALALALCCALRLARFNVSIEDPDRPAWKINYFTGVNAPAGAMLAMLPMYLGFLDLVPSGPEIAPYVLPYIAFVAISMVSRVPTFSGKGIGRVSREAVLPLLAAVTIVAALLVTYPWEMLTLISAGYLALIPVSGIAYMRQKKAWEERVAGAPDTADRQAAQDNLAEMEQD
ncbi:MAG: phosphatidylcholine/phosphatidylserine synthase [Anderseniella sp.]|nr:phosphatidylcholine/phosphatidylserine synthase [Anderseniella sp.]